LSLSVVKPVPEREATGKKEVARSASNLAPNPLAGQEAVPMRALLILLALAVIGLGFTTWTLATLPDSDRPDSSPTPDDSSVAVPCELLPEGEAVCLLASPSGCHMLEPAMGGTEPQPVSISGERRKAWVFVVFSEQRPEVRVE
jgi:hypothetical protein